MVRELPKRCRPHGRSERLARLGLAAWLLAGGCSGRSESTPTPVRQAPTVVEPVAEAPAPTIPTPEFPASTRSLRLLRSVSVRADPAEGAERIGTIAQDIRVRWRRAARGDGCDGWWIEIAPRGWICDRYLEPSDKGPYGVELPRLDPDELVPGTYGKVTGDKAVVLRPDKAGKLVEGVTLKGSITVRKYGELVDERGVAHWKIAARAKEYLAAKQIRQHEPSRFHGVRLGDETGLTLPLIVAFHPKHGPSVPTYGKASGGGARGKLSHRSFHTVREIARDTAGAAVAYRVDEDRWVRASDARLLERRPPPPGLLAGERWLDVDLDTQALLAYEGELPVYATLVSSGAKKTPTPPSLQRIWIKFAETDMKDLAGESPYSVATVPWTQFYAKNLALHTTYWHDKLGTTRSHGCLNLAPTDARFLYFFTDPQVPPGWTMANGNAVNPGSLVRIRSATVPSPVFEGYAMRIAAARGVTAEPTAVEVTADGGVGGDDREARAPAPAASTADGGARAPVGDRDAGGQTPGSSIPTAITTDASTAPSTEVGPD